MISTVSRARGKPLASIRPSRLSANPGRATSPAVTLIDSRSLPSPAGQRAAGGERLRLDVRAQHALQPGMRGGGEQGLGADFAQRRMPPARQRLGAGDRAGGDGDLRLEQHFDLVAVERAAQVGG